MQTSMAEFHPIVTAIIIRRPADINTHTKNAWSSLENSMLVSGTDELLNRV